MKSEFCDNFTIKYDIFENNFGTDKYIINTVKRQGFKKVSQPEVKGCDTFLRQTENRFTRFAETSILQVCCRGSFI